MFSLSNLLLFTLLALVGLYWWQSGVYKGRARRLATEHCRELGLQLLDQSVVITGFWPRRGADGRLGFRRTYLFEFTSTGEQRYRGRIVIVGLRLESIELEPYKLPDSE